MINNAIHANAIDSMELLRFICTYTTATAKEIAEIAQALIEEYTKAELNTFDFSVKVNESTEEIEVIIWTEKMRFDYDFYIQDIVNYRREYTTPYDKEIAMLIAKGTAKVWG